jgi:hypothetical protein
MTKDKFAVLDVLSVSISVIGEYGFVAKKEASAQTPSTASRVQQILISEEEFPKNNSDEVMELIEWALTDYNLKGDFGHTVKEMIQKGAVTLAQVAFLAPLPNQKKLVELREVEKQKQSANVETSDWFGKVGKRDKFFVKVTNKKYVANYDSYIYSVITRDENIGSFFSKKDFEVSVGDCILIKATPKRHIISNWHGGKETQFNRVVIEDNMGTKEG